MLNSNIYKPLCYGSEENNNSYCKLLRSYRCRKPHALIYWRFNMGNLTIEVFLLLMFDQLVIFLPLSFISVTNRKLWQILGFDNKHRLAQSEILIMYFADIKNASEFCICSRQMLFETSLSQLVLTWFYSWP